MYLTNTHPQAPGVWCLCADGQITKRLGTSDLSKLVGIHVLAAKNKRWALTAAADPATDEFLVPWESDPGIAFVGVETSDRRVIDNVAGFRSFPIPLMAAFQTSWGHDGAYVVGAQTEGGVSGENVTGKGFIDTLLPMGFQAARMVETGALNRVSIDPSGGKVETEITEQDEDGWVTDWIDHYVDLEIGGLTLVNISAFAEAKMKLTGVIPGMGDTATVTASAAADPPLWMFDDPKFTERTRMIIEDPDENGHRRIMGHLAPWNECHIGIQNQCVIAPRSPSNYGWFQLGSLKCDDGCVIPIGCITFRGKHAEKHLTARAAADHYDATCMQAADVTMGEDEFGVWYSGALRSHMTDEDVRELRASRLSGDWRAMNGELDLIAAHAVNTGGFPVYEEAIAADGSVQTIIASLDDGSNFAELVEGGRFVDHGLRKALAPLYAPLVAQLRSEVHPQ